MTNLVRMAALAASAAVLAATPAFAANSDTKPFTAKAVIVKPLVLTNDSDLDFGTIIMGSGLTSSQVVVGRAGGSVSSSCGANLTCTPGSAAGFTVAGVANQGLTVTVSPLSSLDDGSGNTVTFTADAPSSVTLNNTGGINFEIGGAITIAAATKDGTYTGTTNVTVSYN